jgi:hypothetical protein
MAKTASTTLRMRAFRFDFFLVIAQQGAALAQQAIAVAGEIAHLIPPSAGSIH